MPRNHKTACRCGSIDLSVSEVTWHRATIDEGCLVIAKADGAAGGFEHVQCQACGRTYAIERFDTSRLDEPLYE